MITQQSLSYIALHDGARYDSFYQNTDNSIVINDLSTSIESVEHKQILLWGAEKSGKSHLLQASCYSAFEHQMLTAYFPLATLQQYGVRIFAGIKQYRLICIDELDVVLGKPQWEEALFHLINQARENNQLLYFAMKDNPRQVYCKLPDLQSRLLWGTNYELKELPDKERALALKSRARQRGFELSNSVIDYIYKRYPRDFSTLMKILDKIDKESLSKKRRITIPFVKEALART